MCLNSQFTYLWTSRKSPWTSRKSPQLKCKAKKWCFFERRGVSSLDTPFNGRQGYTSIYIFLNRRLSFLVVHRMHPTWLQMQHQSIFTIKLSVLTFHNCPKVFGNLEHLYSCFLIGIFNYYLSIAIIKPYC
jgi:hypothetical protein